MSSYVFICTRDISSIVVAALRMHSHRTPSAVPFPLLQPACYRCKLTPCYCLHVFQIILCGRGQKDRGREGGRDREMGQRGK